jgi:hypothetical protein
MRYKFWTLWKTVAQCNLLSGEFFGTFGSRKGFLCAKILNAGLKSKIQKSRIQNPSFAQRYGGQRQNPESSPEKSPGGQSRDR